MWHFQIDILTICDIAKCLLDKITAAEATARHVECFAQLFCSMFLCVHGEQIDSEARCRPAWVILPVYQSVSCQDIRRR